MKCPMPKEAKSSPPFQLVRPATVPPHSFCQIRLPTRSICAKDKRVPLPPRGGGTSAQPSKLLKTSAKRLKYLMNRMAFIF